MFFNTNEFIVRYYELCNLERKDEALKVFGEAFFECFSDVKKYGVVKADLTNVINKKLRKLLGMNDED